MGKGCRLLTVESDDSYIQNLLDVSRGLGFKAISINNFQGVASSLNEFDLTILKASDFQEVGDDVFSLRDWSIILNDGISRKDVNDAIVMRQCSSIFVLDNVEYCANWGKLDRCSAHPDRVKSYLHILRDANWRHYLLELAEARNGHSAQDSAGWEAPHR